MKTGDWINLATTAGVALTAIFTGGSWLVARRLAKISQPIIDWTESGDKTKDYGHVSITIKPPDNERYCLKALEVLSPRDAWIALAVSGWITNPDKTKSPATLPDEWRRKIRYDDERKSSTGVLFKAPLGSTVDMRIHAFLRSDANIAIRQTIKVKMHD